MSPGCSIRNYNCAVIWMTAGIGMTVGVGLYILAIGTIFLAVFFQCVLHSKNPYFQTKQSYACRIKFNKITLKKGDKLLRVHIPRTGARLERDEQVESYRLAADFFKPFFGDDKIVFTCESLKTIMKKGE